MSSSTKAQSPYILHDGDVPDEDILEPSFRRSSPDHAPISETEDNALAVEAEEQDGNDYSEQGSFNNTKISRSRHGRGMSSSFSRRREGAILERYTAAEERTVLRKLDRRLTLSLCGLYLLSFLDRSNIGNAKVAGLQTSLGITSSQFDLTLVAFYVTYITFEWMILLYRLIPPHTYIACCVFAWGLVACLQATVTTFTQLLVLRAALGITEAAFGPGVPFYMTFFYRREELAYRVGLQISAAPLATSFASSLAWIIVKASEHSVLESWRALFLFEGVPSLIAAVFAFYTIPDSPARTYWLTPRERRVASLRLDHDEPHPSSIAITKYRPGASVSKFDAVKPKLDSGDLLDTLKDPHAYLMSLMFLSVNVSFASLPVFLPTIINDMSFSPLTSQILAAPPYLVAFVFVLAIARASDHIANSRGLFLSGCAGLSCASYLVIAIVGVLSQHGHIGNTTSIVIRYVAIYGAACGLFASVVLIITWQLNNQASTSGKGLAMVILNVVGQMGPLIGVQLFPGSDAPYFVRGMAVSSAFMGFVVLLAVALRWWLGRVNQGCSERNRAYEGYQYEMVGLTSAHTVNETVRGRGDDDDGGGGGGVEVGEASSRTGLRGLRAEDHDQDDDDDNHGSDHHSQNHDHRTTMTSSNASGRRGFRYML